MSRQSAAANGPLPSSIATAARASMPGRRLAGCAPRLPPGASIYAGSGLLPPPGRAVHAGGAAKRCVDGQSPVPCDALLGTPDAGPRASVSTCPGGRRVGSRGLSRLAVLVPAGGCAGPSATCGVAPTVAVVLPFAGALAETTDGSSAASSGSPPTGSLPAAGAAGAAGAACGGASSPAVLAAPVGTAGASGACMSAGDGGDGGAGGATGSGTHGAGSCRARPLRSAARQSR